METLRFDVQENNTVKIRSIGGDLRVTARPEMVFEARAPERGRMVAKQDGDLIELDSRSNCLVFVPEQCSLEIESVGGDARVTGVQGETTLGTIGGDLTLRRVQRVSLERAGGDVDVRRANEVEMEWIGGDVLVERVSRHVTIGAAGGDLRVRRCNASVQAAAGGDVRLETGWPAGSESNVQSGGDLLCQLEEQASATVSMLAGGDLVVSGEEEAEYDDGEAQITLGSGEAVLALQSGGDMFVHTGVVFSESTAVDDDFNVNILEGLNLEFLDGLGKDFSGAQADRIEKAVRKAVSRAHRHAGRHRKKKSHNVNMHFSIPGAGPSEATEEEKLSILRMVEAGTITIEEADMLLKALEGGR